MTTPERPASSELSKGTTLTDRLSKALLEEINAGAFQPGQKLPTGQALARRFGVSLTVVRESLSTLKADGIIETRQGAGAFVGRQAHMRPFRISTSGTATDAIGPEQIFELRTGAEVQAAALAATRGTDVQLAAIRSACEDMEKDVAAGGDGVQLDMMFHRRIAEATGNPLFVSFLAFLGHQIQETIATSRQGGAWQAHQGEIMAEHRRLMESVCRRDEQAARDAAYAHMANCLTRCLV